MRQIVTGVDDSGRSCVVAEHVNGPAPNVDRVSVRTAFETSSSPPPPRPAGNSEFIDLKVPVGVARLIVVRWPPGLTARMHYTDTVDVDTVLEGTVDIILDDGPHRLEAGDTVIVSGVDHAWEAGPSGATVSVLLLGTPSPEA
jgi:quercetin dioxygenase-like cupin family protein